MFYRPIMWTLLKIEAGAWEHSTNVRHSGVCSLPEFISNALAPRHQGGCGPAQTRSSTFYHNVWNFKSGLLISYCWLLGYFSWPTWPQFKTWSSRMKMVRAYVIFFSLPALLPAKIGYIFLPTSVPLCFPAASPCPFPSFAETVSRANGYWLPEPLCVYFEKVRHNAVVCRCFFLFKAPVWIW